MEIPRRLPFRDGKAAHGGFLPRMSAVFYALKTFPKLVRSSQQTQTSKRLRGEIEQAFEVGENDDARNNDMLLAPSLQLT